MASFHKKIRYCEWLNKTNFSFLSSTTVPHDLVQTALRLGYKSVAINDFGGVYGIARVFNDLNYIQSQENVKLKLNYGVELNLTQDHDRPLLEQKTIVLNAFDLKGYQNLCKVVTYSHRNSKDRGHLSIMELGRFCLDGVFAIIPMRGGLSHFIKEEKDLEVLKELFRGQLYIAITKTLNQKDDSLIRSAFDLSHKFSVKKIISQDTFLTHRSEKNFHDVLMAIKQNKQVGDCLEHHFHNGERSFHTLEQIHKLYGGFPQYKEMIDIGLELDERSSFCLSELKYKYPNEMIPKGHTSQSFLEELCWKNAQRVYGENIPPKVVTILSKELDLIEELKFADYFLTVWDIVAWARSQNILCQGRGSAANSSVCFVLGITSCDPTLFDLLFERFISRERGDPPDIDVDFEHERREEVIQYIYKRYGRARAAMVANVITFKSKGACRFVGKALGVDEELITRTSKALSTVIYRKETLSYVIDSTKKNSAVECPSLNVWKEFSQKLLGFPRHMGVHSGGFILSQNVIDDLVPQEPATMEGRTVIQWSKDDIEELGFFKIDCLSLGMLTAVRKCLDLIEQNYGNRLELYNVPHNDKATYQMIQNADTVGVFQIESRAQQEMAPRFRPRDLYDLVIQIATIRPGPLEGNAKNPLIRRRNGLEAITYPCPELKGILSKTMGVLVFQEQMMRIAVALGDFTQGEANELRKNIGSWNSKAFNRNLEPFMKKLFNGFKKRGLKKEFALEIMNQMKGFAHYGFPESHAISFAFIAYCSAYLKCHYPAAFFASVLNSQPMGFYSPHALLEAAKRDQVELLPLCINHSQWDHTLEALPVKEGRPQIFALRLGFRLLKGIQKERVIKLEDDRKKVESWTSFEHFIETSNLYKDDYMILASCNALRILGLSRADALWKTAAVPYKELIDTEDRKVSWRNKGRLEDIELDFKSFGTSLSSHPSLVIREESWFYKLPVSSLSLSKELLKLKNKDIVSVFGLLIIKQAPPSAKGMVFLTLEDETGFLNLVFTPQVYGSFYETIESSQFICVTGVLQKNGQSHSVMVKNVHTPVAQNIKSIKKDIQQNGEVIESIKAAKHHYT
jgi:error-prone DNA polymerase